jgi:hypothetical protein
LMKGVDAHMGSSNEDSRNDENSDAKRIAIL